MHALALAAVLLGAATAPAPAHGRPPTAPPGAIDVRKLQPSQLFPKRKLHSEFVVEVNKLGQVSRVRSTKPSKDPTFDAQTYGNALQAFIRTPDGRAIPGLYRLVYDYNPSTQRVRRDVAIVHPGGVNPNAQGAANDMMAIARRNRNRTPPPGATPARGPRPAPSVDVKRMPDLPQVMKTHAPR